MTEHTSAHGRPPDTLPVIVFTVKGVRMGTEVRQVSELLDVREAEARALKTARFDEYIRVRGPAPPAEGRRALVVKGGPVPRGIVVDAAEDVTDIAVESIRPIPPLIASASASRAVWGVAMRDDGIIVLVDVSELGRDAREAAGPQGAPATEV